MRPAVRDRLLSINRAFYQTHAASFAATRARLQPGAERIVRLVQTDDSLLDLGCGHGLVARALAAQGHRGRYLGIDSSQDLLNLAVSGLREPWARFACADLSVRGWTGQRTDHPQGGYSWWLGLAVLHHLPDPGLRLQVVKEIRQIHGAEGRAVVSVWDFQRSPRLRGRLVPWSEVGLAEADLEPGDALLDWRHEGYGLRYVHHFPPDELRGLAEAAGYRVEDEFRADGEGGELGLYQLWRASEGAGMVESRPPG